MVRTVNDRIVAVLLFGMGVLGILLLRCVWLQGIDSGRYKELARSQHGQAQVLRAQRGTIYDRELRPLALTVPANSIFANPRHIRNKADTARQLAEILNMDPAMMEQKLNKDKGFVWVSRQVTFEQEAAVRERNLRGVGFVSEPTRYYPHDSLGSHLLGFVNIDQRGLEGMELAFNGALAGNDGWRWDLMDARGKPLEGPWSVHVDPKPGFDVYLTIDNVVQQVAEETLEWGVEQFNAKGGSITIMDPQTGAILAMANWPKYDPNQANISEMESRRNRAVTDLFEPGSTFKVVAASALLEEGLITPEEEIFCENGEFPTAGRHVLHDHKPHGTLAFKDVIRVSSNIGVAKATQRLEADKLYEYFRAFGFGSPTGVDLPGEVSGILAPPKRWSALSQFIMPIGHEVSVTPIQLAVMVSTIANGGKRVTPYVVDRVVDPDGNVVQNRKVTEQVRVISRETAEIVQQMMVNVVASGTGRRAQLEGITVAGKTGTAQKIEPNGRYSHSRFVASFVGFGPVPDARFVMVVNMDEPRPIYFGGAVSAPMFKRIVRKLASYLDLKEDDTDSLMAKR